MSGLFVRKCAAAITGQPVGTAPVVAADGARGADIDSASVEWSFFGNNNENYRPVVDPVISRIETHSFDPYAQARPDLYAFQRDAKKAITYYSQMRLDGKFVGTVETTAMGNPREGVLRIFWKKNGGADLEFDMVGDDANLPPICSGYCKKTDLGSAFPGQLGKLGWVVVATKLHGRDIRRSQTEHLFSLPLFEAIATGVAFGIYQDDARIRDLHPTLGTQAPAAIGSFASDSLHGYGNERWIRADAADENPMIAAANTFTVVDVDGFGPGKVMEVTSVRGPVGALYPLKKNNDALADGVTVDRIIVGEKPVSYAEHPEATSITRYEVLAFSRLHEDGNVPMATIDVSPIARADANGRLRLETHVTTPKLGTQWTIPGRSDGPVTEADVALATDEIAVWDQQFMGSVEVAMYKIRTGDALGKVAM